jgi:alanine racemase
MGDDEGVTDPAGDTSIEAAAAPSRAEVVVDLDAVRDNVARLVEVAAPAQVMVVVKADGYGHGMVPVARAARAGGAAWLGVAVLEEALTLREAGDDGPLLAWLAVPGEDYRPALRAGVEVTAYSVSQVRAVAAAARAVGCKAGLQLKVDTGLSRGGAAREDWPEVVTAAREAEVAGDVDVTGVWSHLACSDEPEHPANATQERLFSAALEVAEQAGLRPRLRHLANSAAALTRPSARFDLVRCGLAAYGLSPAPGVADAAGFGLRPAMQVRTRLVMTKRLTPGARVSYGHTYEVSGQAGGTTVGLVPVGYGDGVPRAASSRAEVLVAGRRAKVAGRVCMDQFVADLGDDRDGADADARPGGEVVLFGDGASGEPTAQEWAEACDTISYEIVTRIGGRFVRRHVGGEGWT